VAPFLVFDSSSGTLTSISTNPGFGGNCLALDPQGQVVAMGTGLQAGLISTYTLQSDGTLGSYNAKISTSAMPVFKNYLATEIR
jgi:hypothetical protein